MKLSKKYAQLSVLSLCITGAGLPALAATLPALSVPPVGTLAADGDKKDDKGEKIAVDKLPKAVVDAVKKDMPGARITKANKLSKEGKITYYLDDVKAGKKGWDFTVAEDGTIVKKEECHDE